MLPDQLDSIDESHLSALVTDGVRESRSLEFKAELVLGTDSDRKEFLADVSALANGGGGDLILGIEDDNGTASAVVGLESFDPDKDTLRIESVVRDGIAPRIVGLRVRRVALSSGSSVVVIRVPNSLNRPHMVVFKQWSRFYSRNSAGKYQLDVHELRSAFVASESVTERIRQYRIERIDTILQGNTPKPLAGKSYLCIHMIPISAFDPSFSFDITNVQERGEALWPIGRHSWGPRVNLDGLLSFAPVRTGGALGYAQLFRNGVIEAVDCDMLAPLESHRQRPEKCIPSIAYERDIIRAVDGYIKFYKKYEMPTPVLIGLSILNVKGFRMGTGNMFDVGSQIDRDHLILPDLLAESLDFDTASFRRPCFDQIWNACGYERSLNYDEKGNWKPDR